MAHEISSKSMDGITDLVVVAPIRAGFIHAYENVTYATRLRIVAEALNRVRIAAREYEPMTPFSDVTERILTLLDFRIGVIDEDVFGLVDGRGGPPSLESRRFLYLTATFDGAWEPYMRLIWDPLGPFLDLLFCNCDGYVTAAEHSFDEYSKWVRDHQVDSAIFYATTGLTVRDHLYLSRLEQLHRALPAGRSDLEIAKLTMPRPEAAAGAERAKALRDLEAGDPAHLLKIHELALEALTVLYRLADYYPPEWLAAGMGLAEGRYLMRATEALLLGWDEVVAGTPEPLRQALEARYGDPLRWFRQGRAHLRSLEGQRQAARPAEPILDESEIQGGVLKAQGSIDAPMVAGALLLMSVADSAGGRAFLNALLEGEEIHFAQGPGSSPARFFRSIAITAEGLKRLGLRKEVLDFFPKEYREGMERRSGLIGDMRENHPRNWTLPERNWPEPAEGAPRRPPIETSEIDILLQIRSAEDDRDGLIAEIRRIAELAAPGVTLQGVEPMHNHYADDGTFVDHFGFHDGISQPKPVQRPSGTNIDEVPLGEMLLGYRNARGDIPGGDPAAPAPGGADGAAEADRRQALDCQRNGTYLVIRKLEQDVGGLSRFLDEAADRISREHRGLATPMDRERLLARMLGRERTGAPLVPTSNGSRNAFNYKGDPDGLLCPHAAHIRRANPREPFQGRPAPRLMRRGMSYGDCGRPDHSGRCGLMFMAYNASIAEQFETVQRWLNGGNSTYVASGHNDPLLGVAPRTGAMSPCERVFRFVEGEEVIRLCLPRPFVSLQWGIYAFVPSRDGLRRLAGLEQDEAPMPPPSAEKGREAISRLGRLQGAEAGREWKRLLEDFDAKDPAERAVTPDLWEAVRTDGGVLSLPPIPSGAEAPGSTTGDWDAPPDSAGQKVLVAASRHHVMEVLSDWDRFTTEEQLRRIERCGIPNFVTQDPKDDYHAGHLSGRFHYAREAKDTNAIVWAESEEAGFADGYAAGRRILDEAKRSALGVAALLSRRGAMAAPYFEIELRREYLLPALGGLCHAWYGLPDGKHFQPGPWLWEPPSMRQPPGARCPGDFLSPSRYAFYPRPEQEVEAFALQHGQAIHDAGRRFVDEHWNDPEALTGRIARRMFEAEKKQAQPDREVLVRNLIGTMIGAIPPMDGNLRGVLLEWFGERSFWRHQAALRRAMGDRMAGEEPALALAALSGPVSRAICKRPAPDLIYRTVRRDTTIDTLPAGGKKGRSVPLAERDLVVVSLVSATQGSFADHPDGDVSIVFGGHRRAPLEQGKDPDFPVHACPARNLAMGGMMGILAALLDAGRVQALPASLIVRISGW